MTGWKFPWLIDAPTSYSTSDPADSSMIDLGIAWPLQDLLVLLLLSEPEPTYSYSHRWSHYCPIGVVGSGLCWLVKVFITILKNCLMIEPLNKWLNWYIWLIIHVKLFIYWKEIRLYTKVSEWTTVLILLISTFTVIELSDSHRFILLY